MRREAGQAMTYIDDRGLAMRHGHGGGVDTEAQRRLLRTHDDAPHAHHADATTNGHRGQPSAGPAQTLTLPSVTPPHPTKGTRVTPPRFFPRQALLPGLSPGGEVVAWLLDWWLDALHSWSGVSSGDYGYPMMSPLWNSREFRELRRSVGLLAEADRKAYIEVSGWFFECDWVRRYVCPACGRVAWSAGLCSHGRRSVQLRLGLVRVPARGAEPRLVASAVGDLVGLWRGTPRVPVLLAEAWTGRPNVA